MTTELHESRELEPDRLLRSRRALRNLSVPALYEEVIRRREGQVAKHGPLVCGTGRHTGRSPNDKFIVREPSSEQHVWWGSVNRPLDPVKFDGLHRRVADYLRDKRFFVQDCYAGADPGYRLPIRIITETAWHSLFARHMFIPETDPARLASHTPEFTVIDTPRFNADPAEHGLSSSAYILVHFGRRLVLIGGTGYAGEIKKSIFTVMNYLMPLRNVMSMHCSANEGPDGDVALFFGLSGTGKTTLSSDSGRRLIGDDEHGWADDGVFNFEGGCYAKMIRLSAEAEPQIYRATRRFGTVLENVRLDMATRSLDLDDCSLTENTRGAYPLSFIENSVPSGRSGHPKHIVMLSADAFGVLPPISRISAAGAIYHFLSGYTAKVGGTETGVTDPKAVFSTCFGAPFMILHPGVYARMLGERIARHDVKAWLVNTGWIGGPAGVGRRMSIADTRSIIRAALSGSLESMEHRPHALFNLDVPVSCPGVPADVLNPRGNWPDGVMYDTQANRLARMFVENFKQFESSVESEVHEAGPQT